MPSRSVYNGYYESGNAARKRNYIETPDERNNNRNVRYGKNKVKTKTKPVSNSSKALFIISIISAFSILLVITYRYNVISERNLTSQKLKSNLEAADANLLASKIAVEQNTNIDYIEDYAKQKLGMQKPTSSQTIYVDTSNITQVVEVKENLNVIESIISKIKEAISSIF